MHKKKQLHDINVLSENHSKQDYEYLTRTLLSALKLKDNYTYEHSLRVAFFSLLMGKKVGLNADELFNLELGALFHDIGKIGTPDKVLLKPSRLDEEEFHEMSKHPVYSAEILSNYPHFNGAALIARHHHERYDGKGYPAGLKAENIPLASRIILIADTFDAMITDRPYRKGLSHDIAFEELREFAGSQFDPKLVEVFIEAMQKHEQTIESQLMPSQPFKKAA